MPDHEVAARLDPSLLGFLDGSLEYVFQVSIEEAMDAGVDRGYQVIEAELRARREVRAARVAEGDAAGVSGDELERVRVSCLERQRVEGSLDTAAWLLGLDREAS